MRPHSIVGSLVRLVAAPLIVGTVVACASGGLGGVPRLAQNAETSVRGAVEGCPTPPPLGDPRVGRLTMTIPDPPTIGLVSSTNLDIATYTRFNVPISGPLAIPLKLKLTDAFTRQPRLRLNCSTYYQSGQVISLIHGVPGADVATLQFFQGTQRLAQFTIATRMPKEVLTGHPRPGSPVNSPISLAYDGKGYIWGVVGSEPVIVGRFGHDGGTLPFSDSNHRHMEADDGAIVSPENGVLWAPYQEVVNNVGIIGGLDSVSAADGVRSYALPATQDPQAVESIAASHDGDVWISTINAALHTQTYLMRWHAGRLRVVAGLNGTAYSLVADPLHRGAWFLFKHSVGFVSNNGKIHTYPIRIQRRSDVACLTVGSDERLWLPFPFGTSRLLKFDLSGHLTTNQFLAYPPGGRHPVCGGQLAHDDLGNLYESDLIADGLIEITAAGKTFEFPAYSAGQMSVRGVAIGADDELYLADDTPTNVGGLSSAKVTLLDMSGAR